ncbi:unnamed protein product [Didymodactylos carnosus]|uniref:adenosine kinase n=1 Tax=Didymodactylos carnosus TaxID=1234261 RepID=A0A8S2DSG6_9BILA|nr:unnamed protein product [Didymodactylos carnosus]CAF3736252.1 unnamed protein product [Didymodactylos carnosus]
MSGRAHPTKASLSTTYDPHPRRIIALPVQLSDFKCDTCKAAAATALCIGCYGCYCVDCFPKHRQKISKDFGNTVYEDPLFEALFKTNSSQATTTGPSSSAATPSTKKFDPLDILRQIDLWKEDVDTRVETTVQAVRQSLNSHIDNRYDAIFSNYQPITKNLRTKEEARRYIESTISSIEDRLCEINNDIEKASNTPSLRFKAEEIDLKNCIKLTSTINRSDSKKRSASPHSSITESPLDFFSLGRPPSKRVEHLGDGMAIGASDKFIMYTTNDDLCVIELSKTYRIVTSLPAEDVADISWCEEADYFAILTKQHVYTFNPNTKELDYIDEIQLSSKGEFWRCTYAGNTSTLLLCYSSRGSPIEEWKLNSPKRTNSWQTPQSCDKKEFIQCIRVSLNGSNIGLTISSGKEDYFVIRDRAMNQIHQIPLRVADCISFVSLLNNTWLLSVLHYHKMFEIKGSNYELIKIAQAEFPKMAITNFSASGLNNGTLFAIGNPLLDINAKVDLKFLEKFREVRTRKQSHYLAGGSTQNMMRTATWFLQKPKVASYMGCVGNDHACEILRELAEKAGLITSYQTKADLPTGQCAVLITQNNRSMIASLGASQHFSVEYFEKPENRALYENAQIICCEETKLFAKHYLDVQALRDMSKLNTARPRTIVISRPPERTLVGTGFLASVALGKHKDKDVVDCVKAGMYCAYECLQQTGCTFPEKVSYDPTIF